MCCRFREGNQAAALRRRIYKSLNALPFFSLAQPVQQRLRKNRCSLGGRKYVSGKLIPKVGDKTQCVEITYLASSLCGASHYPAFFTIAGRYFGENFHVASGEKGESVLLIVRGGSLIIAAATLTREDHEKSRINGIQTGFFIISERCGCELEGE